jgi:hypothetical protein
MDSKAKITIQTFEIPEILTTQTNAHSFTNQTTALQQSSGKCFSKFPSLRNQTNQKTNNNGQGQTGQKKYCRFCQKDGHTEEKHFALEKAEKKLKLAKARISEIHKDMDNQSPSQSASSKTKGTHLASTMSRQ